MSFRLLLIGVFSISLSVTAMAQDKIFKSNGDVIDTKIRTIGPKTIIYVRYDNQDGPEYTILKKEVDKVKYQNGSEENFNNKNTRSEEGISSRRAANEMLKSKYKRSILALAPIQVTENGLAGIGISYERAIDKNDIVSFYLPVIFDITTNSNGDNNGNSSAPGSTNPMVYLMPGIKIYPTGGYGLAKYAVGPSLVLAGGEKSVNTGYDPVTGAELYQNQSHVVVGIMINQSLNINPTPHLYIGSEFGFGLTYLNDIDGDNKGVSGLVQFSFKVGYRY